MAKKKRKKHIIKPTAKGPQSKQYLNKKKKGKKMKFGLNDQAMAELGYTYPLGKLQKVLFVISICMALIPFWFLLEKKRFAQGTVASLLAFMLNIIVWIGLGYSFWYFIIR